MTRLSRESPTRRDARANAATFLTKFSSVRQQRSLGASNTVFYASTVIAEVGSHG
jgi:hypothetical protein